MSFYREDELLQQLKGRINKATPFKKKIVVFDADGTLWPEDINDIFLNYLTQKGLRDLSDLLKPYYRRHRQEYCELFTLRQAGFSLKEFKLHSRQALKEKPLHVFPFQKKLLLYLKQEGLKICVVTASIKWLVEIAIQSNHLPVDQVLGAETLIKNGKLSSQLLRPSPINNKKEVFLKYYLEENCLLAGGNTKTDLPLLEIAQIPFVVHSARKESFLFPIEEKLKAVALKKKWIIFEKTNNRG